MAKNNRKGTAKGAKKTRVEDYRHGEAKRKNNPPAKIAAEGTVPVVPKAEYAYSPRRPPVLRFDPEAGPDRLPELPKGYEVLRRSRAGRVHGLLIKWVQS